MEDEGTRVSNSEKKKSRADNSYVNQRARTSARIDSIWGMCNDWSGGYLGQPWWIPLCIYMIERTQVKEL